MGWGHAATKIKAWPLTVTKAQNQARLDDEMTLKQVYPSEYQRVQYAFKNSMIH